MIKIPTLSIPVSTPGFFSDKNFVWSKISNFSVITGINGSGKTKLLEHINKSKLSETNIIRYIGARYQLPAGKNENEFKNAIQYVMTDSTGKVKNINNGEEQDWSKNKINIRDNVLPTLDQQIIFNIMEERSNLSIIEREADFLAEKKYSENFNIKDLLPEDKEKDKSWDRIDRIFNDFGLKIRIHRYNLNGKLEFLRLNRTNDSEIKIELKDLSSGEQVAFALALWTWGNIKGQKSEVLLIDEFDAHLNPSIAKKFIANINAYFVDLGVQVIMTTHNPSTVLYANEVGADIKWMDDGLIDSEMAYEDIISILSDGLLEINKLIEDSQALVNEQNRNCVVYTEGLHDKTHLQSAIAALNLEKEFEPIYIFGCTGAQTIPFFISLQTGKTKRVALLDNDKEGVKAYNKLPKIRAVNDQLLKKQYTRIYVSKNYEQAIEHLFPISLRGPLDPLSWDKKQKKQFAKKMAALEYCKPEYFKEFEPLLKEILVFAKS